MISFHSFYSFVKPLNFHTLTAHKFSNCNWKLRDLWVIIITISFDLKKKRNTSISSSGNNCNTFRSHLLHLSEFVPIITIIYIYVHIKWDIWHMVNKGKGCIRSLTYSELIRDSRNDLQRTERFNLINNRERERDIDRMERERERVRPISDEKNCITQLVACRMRCPMVHWEKPR